MPVFMVKLSSEIPTFKEVSGRTVACDVWLLWTCLYVVSIVLRPSGLVPSVVPLAAFLSFQVLF